MSTLAPVYTAIQLVVASLSAALGPTAHWQRAEGEHARPYLIFDSQDRGGLLYQYVGSEGWRGLITIRAIASFQDEADAALAPVYTRMAHLTIESGYTIAAIYKQPVVIPPSDETRYAAAQWELFIERA